MMKLLGLGRVAAHHFPDLTGRGAGTPLDRTDAFSLDSSQRTRDSSTGVIVNVPLEHLQGWVAAVGP